MTMFPSRSDSRKNGQTSKTGVRRPQNVKIEGSISRQSSLSDIYETIADLNNATAQQGYPYGFFLRGCDFVPPNQIKTYVSRSLKRFKKSKKPSQMLAFNVVPESFGDGLMISMGRSKSCDIILLDRSISSFHASLVYSHPNWTLSDNNSNNGTQVNECELKPNRLTIVKSWDKINFGQAISLVFVKTKDLLNLMQSL